MSEYNIFVTDVEHEDNVYFVLYNKFAKIANKDTEVFVTPSSNDWQNYTFDMTNIGEGTNLFAGEMPSWVTDSGIYYWVAYHQVGGSPAATDTFLASGSVIWDGSTVLTGITPPIEGSLFTVDEYKTFKCVSDLDCLPQIEMLIPAVSSAIRTYLGRGLVSTMRDEIQNGRGTHYIKLDHYPITNIRQITFNYHGGIHEVIIDGGHFTYEANDMGTVRFRPSSEEARLFNGLIMVEYDAGYGDDLPQELKIAAMMLLDYFLSVQENGTYYKSYKLGDEAYTINDLAQGRLPEVISSLVQPYKAINLL